MKLNFMNYPGVIFLTFLGSSIFSATASYGGASAALSEMQDANGKNVGRVHLKDTKNGIELHVSLQDLRPGNYKMHFHEIGKCEGPDFESAGKQLKIEGRGYYFRDAQGIDCNGWPTLNITKWGPYENKFTISNLVQQNGRNSLLGPNGAAIIIHDREEESRLREEESRLNELRGKGSGRRLYCGVIKKVEPDPLTSTIVHE